MSQLAEADMDSFDLGDPQTLYRAYQVGRLGDLYRQLQAEAPVWRLPGKAQVYLVTSRVLVDSAVGRTGEFSSNMTGALYRDDSGAPAVYEMIPLDDPAHALATADPPSHTMHRRLLQSALTPRAVRKRTPAVREIVVELLSRFSAPTANVATELADPLTMRVICDIIGIPLADADELVEHVLAMDRMISGLADHAAMDAAGGSALELGGHLTEYLYAAPPDGSVLGTLRREMADGNLSETHAVSMLLQLVAAGTETTATLIGHAVRELAEDPEQQDELREHPNGIPGFLERMLRDDGPFQYHYRTTRHDAPLGNDIIPGGSIVLLMWAAANQQAGDENGRADAATAGGSPPHLAFGRGTHFCVGAHLARMEAAVALEELLAYTDSFVADRRNPFASRPSLMMSRPTAVNIRWVARR